MGLSGLLDVLVVLTQYAMMCRLHSRRMYYYSMDHDHGEGVNDMNPLPPVDEDRSEIRSVRG